MIDGYAIARKIALDIPIWIDLSLHPSFTSLFDKRFEMKSRMNLPFARRKRTSSNPATYASASSVEESSQDSLVEDFIESNPCGRTKGKYSVEQSSGEFSIIQWHGAAGLLYGAAEESMRHETERSMWAAPLTKLLNEGREEGSAVCIILLPPSCGGR